MMLARVGDTLVNGLPYIDAIAAVASQEKNFSKLCSAELA
jgi:hypothetical protein